MGSAQAAWETVPFVPGIEEGQSGIYAGSFFHGAINNVNFTANQAQLVRFSSSRSINAAIISFPVNVAAGSNDNVDVGIYDSNLNRVVSSGSTAGKLNAVGVQTVTFAQTTLPPGVYYAAFASGPIGTTAAQFQFFDAVQDNNTSLFGTAAPRAEGLSKAASFPLPATIAAPNPTRIMPLMAVRES